MPVATFPAVVDQLLVTPPGVTLDPTPPTTIVVGHAVAVVDVTGTATLKLCGALTADRPDLFFGFVHLPSATVGASVAVTGRGSVVVPIVESGAPLVVNGDVWLAPTVGEVTQTVPTASGSSVLRVGFAVSTTQIMLAIDFRQDIP